MGVKPRQLFVTRSQNLADKVRESFARLYETHVLGSPTSRQDPTNRNTEFNEQITWSAELPSSFAALTAEHFPLFMSFDTVSKCQNLHLYWR
jgi:hypothetical protein